MVFKYGVKTIQAAAYNSARGILEGDWPPDFGRLVNPIQRMTEAEHNWPIPKFFGNQPSASAAEVFGETIGLVKYLKISLELCLSPYSYSYA